ncbi:MAG: SRPBCC family protein [Saprospiraceae bacterium]
MAKIVNEPNKLPTMKFKCSVEINKSREEVVKYFINPQYLGEYQDGFIRKELVRGESCQKDAVSKMYYKQSKLDMEITETIIENNLPESLIGFYHHEHMDNYMQYKFTWLGNNKTLYESEIDYIRINWIMPRLMAILFPSMYRKQVEKWMRQFKEFVEKQ